MNVDGITEFFAPNRGLRVANTILTPNHHRRRDVIVLCSNQFLPLGPSATKR